VGGAGQPCLATISLLTHS